MKGWEHTMSNAIDDIKKYGTIHFIGIGGVSMSGIAETIKNLGVKVTGSDWAKSSITDKRISDGIDVTIGSDLNKIKNADLVVYTAAIPKDDKELAKQKLSEFMSRIENSENKKA